MVTLKHVLQLNSLSCIGFGILFAIFPYPISAFLSNDSPAPILILLLLGIGLILHGLHLLWASLQAIPNKALIQYFSAGDFLWVLATAILIVFNIWVTTLHGISTAILVAIVVGLLGLAQIKQAVDIEKPSN